MDPSTLEKGDVLPTVTPDAETGSQPISSNGSFKDTLIRWNARIESFSGVEARGVARVLPSERQPETAAAYMQMALLWFSTNITANNLTLAMLGPLVYDLGFTDSALLAVFGSLVGCAGAAYMGTFGPRSGNRTMIIARYFMGYWPSKICCLLNIVIMLGYGMIDCIVGGQILSAVSGGHMTVIVGIVIVAVITWIVTVFGISVFHIYERWAWLPQVLVLFILFGCAGPHFDTSIQTTGDTATVNGNRLSYFSLCLSAPVAWAPSAADYFVYYPEHTAPWKTFVMAFLGMGAAYSIVDLLGVGLASGTFTNPAWDSAYSTSESALIVAGYDGLAGFGKFCSVIVSLGVIANNIPGTYSAALGFQVMGRRLATVPRWVWTTISVIIYLACALGGRNSLFDIFEDWLALMGYWVTIFLCIVSEEQVLFRRAKDAFDWDAWNDPARLPLGLAAMTAFLIGWAGAIICMDQVYYVGPVAAMVGEDGADMGIWVGCAFTLVVFPGLRWLELRVFKR
ncbi:putative vitamin B6 transporter [Saccharata proteae CBS 121410]|uniref:Vitamin B6 transporter n=1 Tax=Saccharata proteae CBS 121410 TaxID=1314787 RepID=A0A9P4LXE6_9PEZI|nr:putative vitamin B6 transporter [Saccharata proteae CBS 121410]